MGQVKQEKGREGRRRKTVNPVSMMVKRWERKK